MKEFLASKPVKIAAIALGMIVVFVLACNIFTPNPIWGPRILKDSPVDVSVLEPLAGRSYFSLEEREAWSSALNHTEGPLVFRDRNMWESHEDGRFGIHMLSEVGSFDFSASLLLYDTPENVSHALAWERERHTLKYSLRTHSSR